MSYREGLVTKVIPDNTEPLKKPVRVLVVDDLADVRQSLITVISLEDNIEVVGEAASGREAVRLATLAKPDVVVMDLEMPEPDGSVYDGIMACSEIKECNLAKVVIILTIHIDLESRKRAQAAKCDYFIEKGTELPAFLKLISEFKF
jgi:DNA-binding NarL/FixJ family response regulator